MIPKELTLQVRKAIKAGDVDTVSRLISGCGDLIDVQTPFGTFLHVAAAHGQLAVVKYLCSKGIDVNRNGGIAGGTALHLASSDGHYDIVEYLLDQNATMDISEPERNPLFGAIHWGHADIAKLLIDRGIDTKVTYSGKNMKDMDALAFAREWGRMDIVNLLLNA